MAGASLFLNLARGAKVAALLCFFLPFVTVSCSSRELASVIHQAGAAAEAPSPDRPDPCVLIQASGAQLAMATAEPSQSCLGVIADMMTDTGQQQNEANGPFGRNDYAVIGAAAAILLTLLLGFALKGAAGIAIGIAGALAALGAVAWSVFVRIPAGIFGGPGPGGGPQLTAEQARQVFTLSPGSGFWLMAGALLAAIVCYILALGSRKPAPAETPPAT